MHPGVLFCKYILDHAFLCYCFRKYTFCIWYTLWMKIIIFHTKPWTFISKFAPVHKLTEENSLLFKRLFKSFNICTCLLSFWFSDLLCYCFNCLSVFFSITFTVVINLWYMCFIWSTTYIFIIGVVIIWWTVNITIASIEHGTEHSGLYLDSRKSFKMISIKTWH